MKHLETLADWNAAIRDEVPFIDKKPYSHNIITISLQAVARRWGNEEANKIIREFDLDKKGWVEQ